VTGSAISLHVIASSVTDVRSVVLSQLESSAELRAALRGGATIPFLAGPPVEFRGMLLLDAAVLQPHPYEVAVADGCTHVLSLSTRPRGRIRTRIKLLDRLNAWRLDRLRHGLGAGHLRRIEGYGRAQLQLEELTDRPAATPYVYDVALPRGSVEVPRLTRDLRRILDGAQHGYEAAVLALERRHVRSCFRLTCPPGDSFAEGDALRNERGGEGLRRSSEQAEWQFEPR
jgi:predicted patatin/cPLA2 family phospholipase